jgi:acetyl esterase
MTGVLNRDAAAALEAAGNRERSSLHLLPIEEARLCYERENTPTSLTPSMHEVSDVQITPQIPARIYRPTGGTHPAVLFFHGGGWVVGSLQTHDRLCRELAAASGCAVVSVGYRLAPEHPFPSAVDDAEESARWVRANATRLHLDADRLAVAGDSAGGNIAIALALRLRGTAQPVELQLLFYPVTTTDLNVGIDPRYEHLVLSGEELQWHQDQYLPDAVDRQLSETSPLDCADLADLPRAVIVVAECDPIAPQGLKYAEALRAAQVEATVHVYPGTLHGFVQSPEVFRDASEALGQAADALRGALCTERRREESRTEQLT